MVDELARRLSAHRFDLVCGPLVEGAFLALMVAHRLSVPFTYAERFERPAHGELYPVDYRLPGALRRVVNGKRVAVVNDVISAGSAVRGAVADLETCGATPVTIGTLLVLGDWTRRFGAEKGMAIESLAFDSFRSWTPADCPLCARGMPLTT
ncbi:MAG TPA: phosphoribosyltransferase family protein [Thermoanaerobaculia bacterium]|nr:phosphoribosyltransferase family protein [Thermoanaerobaculia bacterium]